jgi:hypothetical protein
LKKLSQSTVKRNEASGARRVPQSRKRYGTALDSGNGKADYRMGGGKLRDEDQLLCPDSFEDRQKPAV